MKKILTALLMSCGLSNNAHSLCVQNYSSPEAKLHYTITWDMATCGSELRSIEGEINPNSQQQEMLPPISVDKEFSCSGSIYVSTGSASDDLKYFCNMQSPYNMIDKGTLNISGADCNIFPGNACEDGDRESKAEIRR